MLPSVFAHLQRAGRRSHTVAVADVVADVVADGLGVDPAVVWRSHSGRPVNGGRGEPAPLVRARQLAIYLLVTVAGRSSSTVAAAMGISQRRVRVVVAEVAHGRDADPALDRQLDEFELAILDQTDVEAYA